MTKTLDATFVTPQIDMQARAETIAMFFTNLGQPQTALPDGFRVRAFRHQQNFAARGVERLPHFFHFGQVARSAMTNFN